MKSFKEFVLQEALLNILNSDIDLIYQPIKPIVEKFHKDIINSIQTKEYEDIQKNAYQYMRQFRRIIKTIPSSQLKSPVIREANAIKPINILVLNHAESASYNPSKSHINIGISMAALHGLTIFSQLTTDEYNRIQSDFSHNRYQQTIRHELTHCIDDAIHKLHLSKGSNNAEHFEKIVKGGTADAYLGPTEINAAIHQLAEIKRRIGVQRYNMLTWSNLLELSPGLQSLDRRLGRAWRKKMFLRMSRENLIGPKMKI
jgi:hypothetical protein